MINSTALQRTQAETLLADFNAQATFHTIKDFARREVGLEEHACSLLLLSDEDHVYLMQDGSMVHESTVDLSAFRMNTDEFKALVSKIRGVPQGSLPDRVNCKAIDEALARIISQKNASLAPLLRKENDFNMTRALLEAPLETAAQAA